ncbi:transcription initiation at TATA-containing promoter protein [Gnomoniopsis sp. IMI 355080]|nr:transcription initiation at TATA-containing promoter protein [Gnomoniopsis sp. IMI 355080]
MATSTAAALGDERNGSGLEMNGHVSPANSQPETTNPQKTESSDDAPSQDNLKSTGVSNKDAFSLNQTVSAMTPPNADAVASAEESVKSVAPEASEAKDTEMVDAPTGSAKPPSPPAEPIADVPESSDKPDPSAAVSVPKPVQSPSTADSNETPAKVEPDDSTKVSSESVPETGVSAINTQAMASTEAPPGDLVTPTTSMSKMALGLSQESTAEPVTADTSMTDAPSQSSAKVAREREEDENDEPVAKRARTSGEGETAPADATAAPDAMAVDQSAALPAPSTVADSTSAPAPASESQATANGSPVPLTANGRSRMLADPALENNPITGFQNKEIRKVLGLIKKTKAGTHFRQSVQVLWPTLWEQYRSLIARPIDISSIEGKLRDNRYATLGQFRKDVNLIEENAVTFNGVSHDVTAWARQTVAQIFDRLALIPAEEPPKPVKQEPKQLPSRHTEPRKPAPVAPKKEARPVASSPADKSNDSQIYALLPSGLPNIRRDSTKTDGDRPKRPIHPPKNKDIGFPAKTSKNKKKPELKFCDEVMKELTSNKNWLQNQWFMEAVDPVALNIPTYHSIVKQPMDLGTMKDKLERGEYEAAKDFKTDFGLIVKNCVKFNGEDHTVSVAAKELEKIFEKKWAEKASWLSKHAPPSAPPTSATSPRGGVRDDSDDEDASETEQQGGASAERQEIERAIETLGARLKSEQSELDKKLYSPTPDFSSIELQRGIIAHLQNMMVEKRLALSKLGETKKGTQSKPAKKKATGGGSSGGNAGSSASKKSTVGGQGPSKKATGGATASKKPVKKKLNDEEKEVVSEAIARLEANALDKAISIIKKDTGLKETDDDELELDMDQLSDGALVKLFDLVITQFPAYKDQLKKSEPASAPAHNSAPKSTAKPKKNKPMGKAEQERKLEQLRELKMAYKRPGSGSQEPLPSVENNDTVMSGNHHDDSDDASSSEEE